jgi:hypothetical protein
MGIIIPTDELIFFRGVETRRTHVLLTRTTSSWKNRAGESASAGDGLFSRNF